MEPLQDILNLDDELSAPGDEWSRNERQKFQVKRSHDGLGIRICGCAAGVSIDDLYWSATDIDQSELSAVRFSEGDEIPSVVF